MKRFFLFATVVALSMVMAMPADAQSRKEKKAAKKEAWETRQQFIRDSTARANQAKLDAMDRDAKAQEEADAKAKAREEAAARAAAEEAQHAKQTAVAALPCEFYDDADWFFATGARRFELKKTNTTPSALLRSLQRQLLDKLQGKYKQVTQNYFDQMDTEDGDYAREHIESAGMMVIQQMVNETYEVCRRQTQYPDAEGKYTMYMAIKVSKKELLEKVVSEISKDQELQVRFNEKKFRDSAFKVFEENEEKEYNEFREQ